MREKLKFHKMQSLGNDFMVVEAITREISLKPSQIKAWANRSRGVGFDQLLLIEPPTDPEVDFDIEYLTPTAQRLNNAAMAPAVWPF